MILAKSRKKIHPLIFLTLMLFVAFSSIFTVNNFNLLTKGIDISGFKGTLSTFFVGKTNEKIQKCTNGCGGTVLGTTEGSCTYDNKTAFSPVCKKNTVNINVSSGLTDTATSGVLIRKNATFQLGKVYAPSSLFAGAKYPSDNTYALKRGFFNLRPASETIDSEYARMMVAPGDDSLQRIENSKSNGSFAVNAGIMTPDSDEVQSGKTTVVVPNKWSTAFTFGRNVSANPDKANRIAYIISNTFVAPGQENAEVIQEDEEENMCLEYSPSGFTLIPSDKTLACKPSIGVTVSRIISRIASLTAANECKTNGNCTKQEVVGIIIDSVYGKPTECTETSCISRLYYQNISRTVAPDSVEKATQESYIATKCTFYADGVEYDTQCLWKNTLNSEYAVQSASTAPGNKDFPTKTEFLSTAKGELLKQQQ